MAHNGLGRAIAGDHIGWLRDLRPWEQTREVGTYSIYQVDVGVDVHRYQGVAVLDSFLQVT
jgi:hypothetical protein